ncbi:hypothetical protein HPB47_025808 [Ixodes persulcatus]|uniref:Uncharacterized protein n=1 Tax=Ixodes persulcatus TaxID=34615 RepID=A0AC60Q2W0_IXOPE|nr:hypothetical protein HPB47_025808 [Ixodes persulcatus]
MRRALHSWSSRSPEHRRRGGGVLDAIARQFWSVADEWAATAWALCSPANVLGIVCRRMVRKTRPKLSMARFWQIVSGCTAVCEENLEEMGGNAALANEFELPFSDLTPTEREMVVRTQNSGLALYEGAIDLPPAPRSPPQSDSG